MKKDWETKPLAEFAVLVSTGPFGSLLHKSDYVDDGLPLVNPINIVGERIVPDSAKLISEATRQRLASYVLQEGDIVVARRGEIGRCAVIGAGERGWLCGTGSFFVRPFLSIDSRFLAYLIRSNDYRRRLEEASTGATMQNLSNTALGALPISVPSLIEQKRIVAILDEAFEGLALVAANAERNLKSARKLFDGYLSTAFTRSGSGWVDKPLSDLIDVSHGYAFDGREFAVSQDADKPIVLTPGNYSEDAEMKFTPENTKRFSGAVPVGYRLDPGDLTIVMTDLSSKMKILGKPAFVQRRDILHNQRIGRILVRDKNINCRYIYYYMRTRKFLDRIKETSTGTMVRHTAPKRILSSVLPIPKDPVQQNVIVSLLDGISDQVRILESLYGRKLKDLAELKQSLLTKAFAGELT